MKHWLSGLLAVLLFYCFGLARQANAAPTATTPLVVVPETKEVQVFGIVYPSRFNAAHGDEAHYHLLVWQGGTSANALIETPADDLALHDALATLGAQPGDNLTMAAWNQRHDAHSTAPLQKVAGSALDIRISWESNPAGISVAQAFRQSTIGFGLDLPLAMQSAIAWRFAGNRARWFNRIPLAPRPGCSVCLYSCPSGKVGNGALSVHDYVVTPSRFLANTAILPPDGTPVIVTFRVLP
ncbi:MAG TPA: YdjY domain-containing protein [Candidatus Binatia bacterium]|nr:YdjY domain-containing protein [Candidatus Binatia bacterium]